MVDWGSAPLVVELGPDLLHTVPREPGMFTSTLWPYLESSIEGLPRRYLNLLDLVWFSRTHGIRERTSPSVTLKLPMRRQMLAGAILISPFAVINW